MKWVWSAGVFIVVLGLTLIGAAFLSESGIKVGASVVGVAGGFLALPLAVISWLVFDRR